MLTVTAYIILAVLTGCILGWLFDLIQAAAQRRKLRKRSKLYNIDIFDAYTDKDDFNKRK